MKQQRSPDEPLAWILDALAMLDEQGLRRRLAPHAGPQQAVLHCDGQELVNFGANDYLALAADSRLQAAAVQQLVIAGCGAGASPLVTGFSQAQFELQQQLAAFEGTEAALVFASGYAANLSAIASLVSSEDAIFADQHNHASMIDACRLSRAAVHVFPHRDCRVLDNLLNQNHGARRRLIVTESVFSMHGDLAPLAELADLAQRHDCMLLVDEAHATGLFGPQGRGLCEQLGVEDRVHVRIGTLSKALGAMGGFVAGSQALVDWLVNRGRSYIFSTALPPAICAAARASLEIVRSEPQRRTQLAERAQALRGQLRARGWNTAGSDSQIIPLLVGTPQAAVGLSQQLREAGLLVPAMRPPSVPGGLSLLRISLSWGHTPAMLERLIEALADCQALGRPVG